MMDEWEYPPENRANGQGVVSAWILAVAVLFGLFVFSTVQQVVSNRPDGSGLAERHNCYHTATLNRNLASLGANRATAEQEDCQVRWLPGPSGDAKREIGSKMLSGAE